MCRTSRVWRACLLCVERFGAQQPPHGHPRPRPQQLACPDSPPHTLLCLLLCATLLATATSCRIGHSPPVVLNESGQLVRAAGCMPTGRWMGGQQSWLERCRASAGGGLGCARRRAAMLLAHPAAPGFHSWEPVMSHVWFNGSKGRPGKETFGQPRHRLCPAAAALLGRPPMSRDTGPAVQRYILCWHGCLLFHFSL